MINDGLESVGGDSGIIGYPLARGVAWYRERLSAGLTGRLSAKRVHKIKHPRQRLNWQGWQVGNGEGLVCVLECCPSTFKPFPKDLHVFTHHSLL